MFLKADKPDTSSTIEGYLCEYHITTFIWRQTPPARLPIRPTHFINKDDLGINRKYLMRMIDSVFDVIGKILFQINCHDANSLGRK